MFNQNKCFSSQTIEIIQIKHNIFNNREKQDKSSDEINLNVQAKNFIICSTIKAEEEN